MFGFLDDGLGGTQRVPNDEIRQVGVLQRHRPQEHRFFLGAEFVRTSGYCLRPLLLAWRDCLLPVHIQIVHQATVRVNPKEPPFPTEAIFRYNRCIGVYLPNCIGAIWDEAAVRWNIKVSKETDLTLRTFLGSQGAKKGDLSKFIEEAVRWRVFHRTVQDIKARNADTDPDELQGIIDDAVREVRDDRRAKGKAGKV